MKTKRLVSIVYCVMTRRRLRLSRQKNGFFNANVLIIDLRGYSDQADESGLRKGKRT